MSSTRQFHGWGYEGVDVDDLVRTCRIHGATVVVDVRMTPISRKKGLSKTALAAALDRRGIRYVHERALGNPKDNRAAFASPATLEGRLARERFRTEVLQSEAGRAALERIETLADDGPVVLLCFEHAERCCHRQQILDELRRRSPAEAASKVREVDLRELEHI